ncbi:ABC-2 type transport system permease protein [Paenibacillus uliginis N3/975]|uniref:ABC-2 type transport system permease protein n=1 Tax=Paenibacillus uliginis N3/975 TaxID=1313296 RepID=A0A1X7GKN6_9BACL|nr:ABC transporter permease subunit [Paenibacillus uliginis]SMF71263.1 ABC-2 type transport system permease protein [Paenibacillus uliginis N3/975]
MRGLWICYKKEMLEIIRSYKFIWVPVVFLLLGIMQPVSTYYLPEILSMSANMPEEALALFKMPAPGEVVAQTLSQYSMIGLLVLVLAGMNTVAGERTSGTGELLLARSISPAAMITAKWGALMTLLVISFGLGLAGSAYYTAELIGPLEWSRIAASGGLYTLWLGGVLSLVLPLGAVLKGPAAAFISLAVAALLSLLSGLFPSQMKWSPGRLSSLAAEWLVGGAGAAYVPAAFAIMIMLLSIAVAALLLRRNTLPG